MSTLMRDLVRRAKPAVLLVMLGLAGCDHEHESSREARLAVRSDALERNPIRVVETRQRLDVPADASDEGGGVKLETARYLHQYRRTGGKHLVVSVPRGSHGQGPALRAVQQAVRAAGIPARAMTFATHDADDQTIRLSYTRIAAVTQPCGDWSESADLTRDTLPYVNFGCAVQATMAAMIAKPSDALYPTPDSPRPAERRAHDQKKYNEGTLTPRTDGSVNTR